MAERGLPKRQHRWGAYVGALLLTLVSNSAWARGGALGGPSHSFPLLPAACGEVHEVAAARPSSSAETPHARTGQGEAQAAQATFEFALGQSEFNRFAEDGRQPSRATGGA